ncbi:MAG TPA: ABC transporter permease [Thermomicrobiales bacterium]|nr:ABC transporter permease [Thermomicrobiales bacterium]
MRALFAKVRRDLRRRPLRNLLTVLGVVFGVAGIVAISVTTRSMVDAQRLTYAGSHQADLATFTSDISPTTRHLIERQPNVLVADTRAVTFTRFDAGSGWVNLRLVGIDAFDAMQLDVVTLVRGRWPEKGEVVFDESASELTALAIGNVVAVRNAPNERITYLTVVGFTRSPAQLGAGLLNRATAYTPASTVRGITGRTGDNFLLVRVDDPQRASQTAEDLSRLLSKRGAQAFGFNVRDPNEFVGSRELGTLLLLLQVFSWLGAALAAVLVANTVAAVMGEETGQIGILKSLGARRWQIVATYLAYATGIGIAGTAAGWAAGTVIGGQITAYLTDLTGLQRPPFGVSARDILLAVLVGTLVTIGATLVPVLLHSRTRPALLLRSPGVRSEAGHPTIVRFTAPLARASSALAIGARNSLRRPGRAAATVGVVAVAVAAFVGTQALSRSVSTTVDELYALYGADGWVSFQRPVEVGYARELQQIPWVIQAEPWTSATGAFGPTRTDIWGMPAEHPLYSYRLVDGTWVRPANPPAVVLSSNLAAEIDARVGETRQIDIGKRRETVQVVGIVDDASTYLGSSTTGKVFMRTADLNRLVGLGNRADMFAFTLTAKEPSEVDKAMADIEERTRDYGPVTYAAYSDQRSSRQAIGVLTLMLNAMVVVVAVVGAAGIANSLLISIAERRREFGILRAVGAGARQVVAILVSEGVMLAIFGLLLGVAAGYPLALILVAITSRELFALSFHLSIQTIVVTFLVAILAVAAISAVPGVVASRIRPIQVLRYE